MSWCQSTPHVWRQRNITNPKYCSGEPNHRCGTIMRYPTPPLERRSLRTSPVIVYLALSAIALVPLLFGSDWLKDHGYLILLAYSLVGTLALASVWNFKIFVAPNAIVFLYITWSMTVGAWGYAIAAVLLEKFYQDYLSLQRLDEALCLTMLIIAPLVAAELSSHGRRKSSPKHLKFPGRPLWVTIVVLTPFLFIPLDASYLGGTGVLNNIPKGLLSIAAIILASNMQSPARFVVYLFIISANAAVSSFDKREAIFLFFVILFLEAHSEKLKINLSMTLKISAALAALVVLILAMSIVRGYGGFEGADTVWRALGFVLPYIRSDDFLAAFFFNIEVNYFFFHGVNSIELVLSDLQNLAYGTTVVKFIFLPLPREFFPWKPDSSIGLYTTAYDPILREVGGSWPINIASELVWNFWWFAPLTAFLIPPLLNKLCDALLMARNRQCGVTMTFFLFNYMNLVTLARGSGLDIYVMELIMSVAFIYPIHLLTRARRRSTGQTSREMRVARPFR